MIGVHEITPFPPPASSILDQGNHPSRPGPGPGCCDTSSFDEARTKCAAVLTEEHQKYIAALRLKISALSKGSKAWWRLNRELLSKRSKCSSIPPLRDGETWLNESKKKADLFAKTFAAKA